jgi:hypothetical protein
MRHLLLQCQRYIVVPELILSRWCEAWFVAASSVIAPDAWRPYVEGCYVAPKQCKTCIMLTEKILWADDARPGLRQVRTQIRLQALYTKKLRLHSLCICDLEGLRH